MRKQSAALLAVASLTVAGCTNRGLVQVAYERPVVHTSNKTASLQLFASVSEATRGTTFAIIAPKVIAPISTGPRPELEFTLQDQRVFVESLGAELNRLKIFRLEQIFESNAGKVDVSIGLAFGPIAHDPQLMRKLIPDIEEFVATLS